MAVLSEPVIVTVCRRFPEPRRAYLADVLLVADRLPAVRLADLFARYPGLTVVLVAGPPGGLVAGIRDGTVLTLRPRNRQPAACRVRAAAVLLYACWSEGIAPASRAGVRRAEAAGFHLA